MQKLLVFAFILIVSNNLFAQKYTVPKWNDIVYNNPKPGALPVNIQVITNGMSITFEMQKVMQLNNVLTIDSVIQKAFADIQLLKDSIFKQENSYRVDYNLYKESVQIRVTEKIGNEYLFTAKNNGLKKVKEYEDTLRINMSEFLKNKKNTNATYNQPFFISLTNLNFSNPTFLKQGMADSILAAIKAKVNAEKKRDVGMRMYGVYSSTNNTWPTPLKVNERPNNLYFEPDAYAALQYVRGSWVPSAAVGFQLIKGEYKGKRDVFKLMWEPHFFFSRDVSNKLISDRNDFITFRYYHHQKEGNPFFLETSSFSVGYLVYRKGDWYEKNTFKFSVPGAVYKFISIEPEFFFNDFFRNFSPSLKLNFNID